MCENKKIRVTIALLLILVVFLSSPFIISYKYTSHYKMGRIDERNIKSSNLIWIYGTGDIIKSVAISSDGQYVAAGSNDNKVYFFNRTSSTPLWSYTTGNDVRSVAISSDGQYVVAGSNDNKVYFFNRTSSTPLWSYTTGMWAIDSVAISSDGQYVAAGSYDNKVYLFNRTSSTPLWSYNTGSIVFSVAISSNGQYIVAGGLSNKVYFFNRTSSTPLWSYTMGDFVSSIAISSDGQNVAAGSNDNMVYFFNRTSSTPLWSYTMGYAVSSVEISSDGQYIAAGGDKIYLFDKASSIPLWNYTTGSYVQSVAISYNGQYIAAGGGDSKVYLFDKTSSIPIWSYATPQALESVDISSNGQYTLAAGLNTELYLFDNTPGSFTLSSDADDPDLDGTFSLNWTISDGAKNYSVYEYSSLITEINGSLTLLADEITDLSLKLSGHSEGTYYLTIVAHNQFGNTLSNCISVVVCLPPGTFVLASNAGDPDDNGLFTLSWTTSSKASNYSVYQYSGFITEINGSLALLENEITDLSLDLSGYSDGTYYFIVVAHNEYGDTLSNCITVVVGLYPSDFVLSSNAGDPDDDGAFTLSWTASNGVDNYSVYRYSGFITEINGSLALLANEITDLSLDLSEYSGGTYYFIVVAHNEYGDTLSNCIAIEVTFPPGSFTLSSNAGDPDDNGLFTLSWTTSSKASNYSVYQYSGFITEINGSLALLENEITDLSLDLSGYSDGTYYFIVVAHNEYGDTLSNCITVVVGLPPGSFSLSIPDDVGTDIDGIFHLAWTVAFGANNYSVYQYSSYITEINGSLTLLADKITDLNLALSGYTDGTYYFIVVAYNDYGDTLSNCVWIDVQLPPPPGEFTLSSDADDPDTDGLFYLSWTDSSWVSNYSVYRHSNYITEINGSLTLLAGEITDLGLIISDYMDGTYYFIVVAHNEYGDTLSNCISVTVLREGIPPGIPGYNLLFIIAALGVTVELMLKRRYKNIK